MQIEAWARPVQEFLTSGQVSPPIFFTAPRGLGKTVLLRELQHEAKSAGFIVVWVTANSGESLISALVSGVRAAIPARWADGARDLLERLDSLKLKTGIPGVLQVEGATRSGPGYEVTFAAEMSGLARAMCDRGASGLMLFVDELQAARDDDLASVVPALQEWTATQDMVPLMFVGAGPTQLPRVLSAHGGFAERFQYVPLERLNNIESAAAFTAGMPDGFRWLADALELAVTVVEGHPYLIQLLGHYAWQVSDASTLSQPFFSRADIELALQSARQDIKRVFEGRWIGTSDVERQVLAAVAASDDGRLTLAQIARESSRSMPDVERAVDSLYANGWLDVDGLERIRVGLPGVRDFVLHRNPNASAPSDP